MNVSEAEVRGFLARGADASDLLRCQLQYYSPEVVKLLLEEGANPNCFDPELPEFTPLYIAVQYNLSPEVIKLLLEAGANPNQEHEFGTLLYIAVYRELCPEGIRLLLEAGANPNKAHPVHPDVTPLSEARDRGCSEIVELLIEAGAK